MNTGRDDLAPWRRSASCYGGSCVEASARGGMVLLRDSKRPDRQAIALAFSEWSAFMTLVRNARWGESFDLRVAARPRSASGAVPASAVACALNGVLI